MEGAESLVVVESALAFVAYVMCPNCEAQCMVTITPSAIGVLPLVSDMEPDEVRSFLKAKPISSDEVLALHSKLKMESLCELLQRQEIYLERKQKESGKN